ncbi:MAG: hypothetical protein K0R83_639 [Caulobacter sp.]|jgi:hypothetical protein|nr:hypothetical protein [Caulobacter sp.]
MTRIFGAALLAIGAGLVMALPATAREPTVPAFSEVPVLDEVIVTGKGWKARPPELSEEEIAVIRRRLPTLAELSRERWNATHRRFESRRPLKRA